MQEVMGESKEEIRKKYLPIDYAANVTNIGTNMQACIGTCLFHRGHYLFPTLSSDWWSFKPVWSQYKQAHAATQLHSSYGKDKVNSEMTYHTQSISHSSRR